MEQRMAYVNTPQTAADMNSILKAIGQRDMLYWGLRSVISSSEVVFSYVTTFESH